MARRAGEVALATLDQHGYPLPLMGEVDQKLRAKLATQPVEDFRIDFEDGYGARPDAEEDEHARRAAEIVAADPALPPRIGIRIRALSGETETRARRTLDLFLTAAAGRLPRDFVVTLPKITSVTEVEQLAGMLRGVPHAGIELMIETPQALRTAAQLVYACEGRCRGAHFGAYDYLSSVGIAFAGQTLRHPVCDFARSTMQMHLADLCVPIVDGVTNLIPAGETRHVHAAWKEHAECVGHALACGIYQGWDIHPAQLVSRYAAVFQFYAENAHAAARRLKNFMERAQQATRIGAQFDDAATVAGLRLFFERAVGCGAMTALEAKELTCIDFSHS